MSTPADRSPGPASPTARIDLGRSDRIDLPEAVYCAGKTVQQCVDIVGEFLDRGSDAVLATRATPDQVEALTEFQPDAAASGVLSWRHRPDTGRSVVIASAGTSDLPMADEARLTLQALGHQVIDVTDIGVAGLHRLVDALPEIAQGELVIAFAGMEGALPTVLAGLTAAPIVAVPTSVGYGTSFDGITALLSMMSSCAPGISVVGIDNGYGAACAAHRILRSIG